MKSEAPTVAIMGRPNVGKSTLMNRLASRMEAIVDPTPGVTRDRKYAPARWRDREFVVVDTGGVGIEREGWLDREVERQAFFAAEEADVLVLVVDVNTGITEDDDWLARRLKRLRSDTIVAVNKVDNQNLEYEVGGFYALGLGEPVGLSAYHGLGIGELLDRITDLLPSWGEEPVEPEIAVAIVGRPNVGKSSILNRLADEERALVHEKPHTTRDTIDTIVESDGTSYRILDTAGIRKKRTGISDVEYYSSIRTFRAIEQADVVMLVIDGWEGPSEHDQRIAGKIESRGRASVILINKWDRVEEAHKAVEVMEAIARKFRFATHLPLLRVSAVTGRGVDKILPLVDAAFGEWNKRIPTPVLNDFLALVKVKVAPPRKGNRELKMYYATQAGVAPPTFVIFVNDAGLVRQDYRRFIARQLREEYGFWGSPLRIHFRTTRKR
ncbi:MAG: ribosome biogenesis GTPase Der [Actinobacteria bacterium]|nr:ribosome biogenesis GTPase Der [Actinomycetota bacterium]MCG2819196.1 ribosome biogenesis GTPase Der [Actinomycetes bacterium]MBU4219066.1 ribosome biogenesis GTPase Der [Actinomycetota bacterium]MBU4359254.1 ribosome biogenesis GTPase Der [Actinomycetota bacterium]MBU4391569.1 ribosome biogenesis GTPase Der [Actinomycetota bacterium]